MFVVCECIDNLGTGEARADALDAHRAYLKSQPDTLRLAGPLSNEDGTPRGSLLIVEVEDVRGARDFAKGGPLAAASAFSDLQCEQFKPKINNLG